MSTRHQATDQRITYRILAFNWRCLRHPQAGGAEVNLFQQANQWLENGHKVTIFTVDPGRDYAPNRIEDIAGIHVIRFGGRMTVYIFALLYALFFSWRYDLLLDVSNGIPFFLPLVTRKPITLLVHHVHRDQWQVEFPGLLGKLGWYMESKIVPWLYRNTLAVAVSPSTEAEMVSLGYNRKNITVVYNGLDIHIPPFRDCRHKPQVTYIGRIKAYKRLEHLVRAIWILQEEFPDIRLDIAGRGDYSEELQKVILKYGLATSVTLHGYISDCEKAALLRRTRVFANPSTEEGWGISVIEANAYGCPTVAYNVPGLKDSIRNNETGLLANDDEEFVDAIARILRDDALMERLSKGAVHWATLFDWQSAASSTLSVMTRR